MDKYGLIGRNISYSFSRGFFSEKFEREHIEAVYENFDLAALDELPKVFANHPDLKGLNVTIPYKEEILRYLDELDPEAEEIGAVNTLKPTGSGGFKGYNTDHYGLGEALKPHLQKYHKKALILGTGGASKAAAYALKQLDIETRFVSRRPESGQLGYDQLGKDLLSEFLLIINCTPLGTFPNTSAMPQVPVSALGQQHLVFDLIYNPSVTKLMELSKLQGATVLNGIQMLESQARKAWSIWNS